MKEKVGALAWVIFGCSPDGTAWSIWFRKEENSNDA